MHGFAHEQARLESRAEQVVPVGGRAARGSGPVGRPWVVEPGEGSAGGVEGGVGLEESSRRGGGERRVPAEVGVEFKVSDDAKKNLQSETKRDTEDRPLPEIFFSPTGETTPFEIAFQERRARVSVTLDGAGGVEVKTDAETQ